MHSVLNDNLQVTQPLHAPLHHEKLDDVLRLIRSTNVGPITFFQLWKKYGNIHKALDALPRLAERGGARRKITIASKDIIAREIESTHHYGAKFIMYGDPYYPQGLLHVPDAPPVLIVHGHSHMLAEPKKLAIVGSRNASANGCRFAAHMAKELGNAGYHIISGLARGIDRYAHQGSLVSGTVGVIAGGINHVYPQDNNELYASMRDQGVIVTEAPFDSAPQHRHFPARNRIIAGMSQGVIVVEAAKKSGSLITVKYGLDYNRDIFAVPGFPMDPRSSGTNQLIQDGATLVSSAHDVIDSMLNRPYMMEDSFKPPFLFDPANDHAIDEESLDMERAMITTLIGATPLAIEELIIMSGVDAKIVNIILLELELAGMITRHTGGTVSRNYDNT